MAIEDLFDHSCEIYHAKEKTTSPGYALKSSIEYSYNDSPDEDNIKCHFPSLVSLSRAQGKPMNKVEGNLKLSFPIGTNVLINDKVVDKRNGIAYIASLPDPIRNHHLRVMVKREDGTQGAL